jgi:hypothetical protein
MPRRHGAKVVRKDRRKFAQSNQAAAEALAAKQAAKEAAHIDRLLMVPSCAPDGDDR